MNTTLSTFFKIGITALTIGILLFGTAYSMTDSEAESYEGNTTSVKDQLPTP
ncbi:hypothetical protein [Halobacillus litoralis]|uniref:hypothetical protein n=1 Tax=Halobacillus litoralis TaxID=45668 RepID=UPI0013E8C132|nr:hypothetical protein [Halobacillus litoralis]